MFTLLAALMAVAVLVGLCSLSATTSSCVYSRHAGTHVAIVVRPCGMCAVWITRDRRPLLPAESLLSKDASLWMNPDRLDDDDFDLGEMRVSRYRDFLLLDSPLFRLVMMRS